MFAGILEYVLWTLLILEHQFTFVNTLIFSMHIFFNYLTYIEAKREIETSHLCVSPFFMKEIKETILNFKYVTVIYQIQLLAYSQ